LRLTNRNFRLAIVWLLGNLARATYVGSSDYMWPFSYNVCDQNTRHSQEVDSCLRVAHYGMKPGRGRGAPEIDVLEAMQGDNMKLPNTHIRRPYVSMSLQIAPGFKTDRPDLGKLPRPVSCRWLHDSILLTPTLNDSDIYDDILHRVTGTPTWNMGT
jgi:Beta-glucan synthesis-associated protein SKN1/KRE6/Sbg1